MQPLCWGPLRVGWADRMLQTDFLHPNAMTILPEQTLFLLMRSSCGWWNNDLENIRNDVCRLRCAALRDRGTVHNYRLVRKIYRATIAQAKYEKMQHVLLSAKDPWIFKYIQTLDTPGTLPAMDDANGNICWSHKDICEHLAAQVDPVPTHGMDTR